MPYVKFQVLTHLHEMGHHVWALGEEYAGDAVLEAIDTSVIPPDNSTIPLVASAYASGALIGNDAILKFGSTLERRDITANTATSRERHARVLAVTGQRLRRMGPVPVPRRVRDGGQPELLHHGEQPRSGRNVGRGGNVDAGGAPGHGVLHRRQP